MWEEYNGSYNVLKKKVQAHSLKGVRDPGIPLGYHEHAIHV